MNGWMSICTQIRWNLLKPGKVQLPAGVGGWGGMITGAIS